MVIGLLAGMETTVDVYSPTNIQHTFSSQTSNQITSTYAPQETIQYSPQLMFNSPGATMGGASQTPTVQVIPTLTPNQTTEQQQQPEQTPDMSDGGDNPLTTVIILAVAGIGAVLLYPKIKKALRKVK